MTDQEAQIVLKAAADAAYDRHGRLVESDCFDASWSSGYHDGITAAYEAVKRAIEEERDRGNAYAP
jgi:hypothetical protein